jgi:hypothetical protein
VAASVKRATRPRKPSSTVQGARNSQASPPPIRSSVRTVGPSAPELVGQVGQVRRDVGPKRAAEERHRGPRAEEELARRPEAPGVRVQAEEAEGRGRELHGIERVGQADAGQGKDGARAELGVLVPLTLRRERIGVGLGQAEGERDAEAGRGRELASRAADPQDEPGIAGTEDCSIVVVDVVGHELGRPVDLAVVLTMRRGKRTSAASQDVTP